MIMICFVESGKNKIFVVFVKNKVRTWSKENVLSDRGYVSASREKHLEKTDRPDRMAKQIVIIRVLGLRMKTRLTIKECSGG